VQYLNGETITRKYKKLENDIKTGKCIIV